MRRCAVLIAAALWLLAGAANSKDAPAPDKARKPAAGKTVKLELSRFHGVVQSVNAASSTLVALDKRGKARTFTVGKTVEITRDNKVITLSGITAGERVTVKYTGSLDKPEVKFILVTGKK